MNALINSHVPLKKLYKKHRLQEVSKIQFIRKTHSLEIH